MKSWFLWMFAVMIVASPLTSVALAAGPFDGEWKVIASTKTGRCTNYYTFPITIDTWGGKPVLDVQGEQTFAEVALVRLFQASGWEARWLETYNAPPQWPLVLDRWSPAGIKAREVVPIGNASVENVLRHVIAHNGGRCRGCWDVLAWRGAALVWAEAKRARHDRLSDTQTQWLDAALQSGLVVESFLIVEWQG